MSKIYSYAEFQKIAKVGMRVRAVEGRMNLCSELGDGAIQLVTEVAGNDNFRINTCVHRPYQEAFLELLDDEPEQPERGEITWESLKLGDEVEAVVKGKVSRVYGDGVEISSDSLVSYIHKSKHSSITHTKLETISLADAEKALGKRIIIKE